MAVDQHAEKPSDNSEESPAGKPEDETTMQSPETPVDASAE